MDRNAMITDTPKASPFSLTTSFSTPESSILTTQRLRISPRESTTFASRIRTTEMSITWVVLLIIFLINNLQARWKQQHPKHLFRGSRFADVDSARSDPDNLHWTSPLLVWYILRLESRSHGTGPAAAQDSHYFGNTRWDEIFQVRAARQNPRKLFTLHVAPRKRSW